VSQRQPCWLWRHFPTVEKSIAAGSPAAEVKIDNFSFTPATLTVKAGTQITWTNAMTFRTPWSARPELQVQSVDTDEKFTFTASKPGTYSYSLTIHPKIRAKWWSSRRMNPLIPRPPCWRKCATRCPDPLSNCALLTGVAFDFAARCTRKSGSGGGGSPQHLACRWHRVANARNRHFGCSATRGPDEGLLCSTSPSDAPPLF